MRARVLMFNRFACFWPTSYQRGSLGNSALAAGGEGGRGAVPPLTHACAPPPFKFTQKTVLETLLNDKTPHNEGKRNNYFQT